MREALLPGEGGVLVDDPELPVQEFNRIDQHGQYCRGTVLGATTWFAVVGSGVITLAPFTPAWPSWGINSTYAYTLGSIVLVSMLAAQFALTRVMNGGCEQQVPARVNYLHRRQDYFNLVLLALTAAAYNLFIFPQWLQGSGVEPLLHAVGFGLLGLSGSLLATAAFSAHMHANMYDTPIFTQLEESKQISELRWSEQNTHAAEVVGFSIAPLLLLTAISLPFFTHNPTFAEIVVTLISGSVTAIVWGLAMSCALDCAPCCLGKAPEEGEPDGLPEEEADVEAPPGLWVN